MSSSAPALSTDSDQSCILHLNNPGGGLRMRSVNSSRMMSRRASKHGRNLTHMLHKPASRRLRLRILIIQLCLLSAAALYWLAQPPQPVQAFSNTIVISQVYGGGGNTSATYKNDFIELYNR